MIETRNLSVGINGSPILKQVSLTLKQASFTALVGPNGAGKSTLLSAIGRLLPDVDGQVLLQGTELSRFSHQELALKLSVLRQNPQMTPRLTVRDLVGFGRFPHSRGRLSSEDEHKVDHALNRLEMQDLSARYLDTLSGGQRQRALIAMVLAQETEVILLDEPLNNLDLVHARTVMRVAKEEVAAGKTVVMVVHDLSVAGAYADHMVALKQGQIHSQGTPQTVLEAANLTDLYDTDVTVIEANGHRIVLNI